MLREKIVKWSHRFGLCLFWPAIAVVVWGELDKNTSGLEREVWDKALHFIAYFGLSGLATVALRGDRRTIWAILGLIAFGGGMEILQGLVGRDMSIYDETANALGAVCGAALGWLVLYALENKSG